MYDRILLPTDGSTAAGTAAKSALALARRFDASLHVIHVTELDDLPADVESDVTEEVSRRGDEILTTIADQAAQAEVTATTQVIETAQPIHRAIVDYATDNDADLIVMGTHGRTGLNRLVLGSVTERTLRVSPVPVLTVHEDTSLDADFERILVPTDGSDPAMLAAEHGMTLGSVTNAAIHIVHVVNVTAASGDFGGAEILDALEETGQRAVDDIIDRAHEMELRSVEASVLSGTPARALLEYVGSQGIDLIVMGTHGRTGLERYLLGSVTEKIVRVADVPVLTVSPSDGS